MPPIGYIGEAHKRKLKTLHAWIEKYQAEHPFSPSRREIAAAFETSTSVIGWDLNCMERLGWITTYPRVSRALLLHPVKETNERVFA